MSEAFHMDTQPTAEIPAPASQPVRVSWQITPDGEPLGKAHSVKAGELVSAPAQRYVEGCTIHEAEIQTVAGLYAEALELGASAHRFSGTFEAGLDGQVLHAKGNGVPGATKEHLAHRAGPGVLCIDIDKGQRVQWHTHDEVANALRATIPWLNGVALLVLDSSGSCIAIDGDEVRGPGGFHVYAIVEDATKIPALLEDGHQRCFLADLGRCIVSAGGSILERSPVDLSLRVPTQPDFMVPHLDSSRLSRTREPSIYLGGRIPADVALLSAAQVKQAKAIALELAQALRPERERVIGERAAGAGQRAHARLGGDLAQHVAAARQAYETSNLPPAFVLPLANGRTCTVAELYANPALAGSGWCLPDPLEPEYGECKAKLFTDPRPLVIQSKAHGSRKFVLEEPIDESPKRNGVDERLTESGNAERFAREHGSEVRYCRPIKKWLVWDGQRWKPDDSGEAERLAKKTIRGIAAAAAEEEDGSRNKALLSWAIKSESAKARAALLQLAQSEEGIPVAPGDLDSNPWLLNVGNGTLDLHTGALRPHEQRDFITKLAPVEYYRDSKCPIWDRFLERVMGGDRELVEFLQRVIGYTLTGEVSAEVLTFHVGTGDNGKSKFVGALQEMLGGYAGSINSELLLTSRNNDGANRATPDVIRLHGLRLAICSETDEGRFLSAAMVKKITSTDKIPARGLHAASTEFRPTHKVFLPTNHRPQVRSADEGTWRRLLLVPWKVRIPPAEQDSDLPNKLRQELPGILAWAVRGCLDWQKRGGGKRGLAAPECVLSATASYRTEEDVIAPFIADRCEQAPDATCAKGAIFAAYQRWATDNNETALTARAFGTRLLELQGISDSKSGGVRFWNGIRTRGAP